MKSLKSRLCNLPQPDVPQRLKSALFAAIPKHTGPTASKPSPGPHRRAWDFGVTAAAAVIVLALLILVNYGLSVPPGASIAECDDALTWYTKWDRNTLLSDQNSAFIEKAAPYRVR